MGMSKGTWGWGGRQQSRGGHNGLSSQSEHMPFLSRPEAGDVPEASWKKSQRPRAQVHTCAYTLRHTVTLMHTEPQTHLLRHSPHI